MVFRVSQVVGMVGVGVRFPGVGGYVGYGGYVMSGALAHDCDTVPYAHVFY